MSDPQVVLTVGVLLMVGVAATAIADRLQVPAFALSLIVGMAIGSDGAGLVPFDDYLTAQRVGTACLALILFEGGWRSKFSEMGSVWGTAARLAGPGTVLTALTTGLAIAVLFNRPLVEALLLGSILASTDTAAVFGLLRRTGLRRRLVLTLEAEAGLNDPVAILLVISLVTWMQHRSGELGEISVFFARDLFTGLMCGVVVGLAGAVAFKSRWLPFEGLYAVASVALAAVAFGAAQSLDGSGFLAVYIAGLILGNEARQAQKSITVFQRSVASLADIALFVTLGLVVSPSQLAFSAGEGTAIALILALIARPLAVFAMTAGDRFSPREKALLSWAGLRGAVPLVLATIPVTQGIPDSLTYFNVVFVVVMVSALVQGTTVQPLARVLGLTTPPTALPDALAVAGSSEGFSVLEAQYVVSPNSEVVGHNAGDLHLPSGAALTLITRLGQAFSPSNSTRIRTGDVLHVLVTAELADVLQAHLWNWGEPAWRPVPATAPHARDGLPPVERWIPFQGQALRRQLSALGARERAWWRQVGQLLRPP